MLCIKYNEISVVHKFISVYNKQFSFNSAFFLCFCTLFFFVLFKEMYDVNIVCICLIFVWMIWISVFAFNCKLHPYVVSMERLLLFAVIFILMLLTRIKCLALLVKYTWGIEHFFAIRENRYRFAGYITWFYSHFQSN